MKRRKNEHRRSILKANCRHTLYEDENNIDKLLEIEEEGDCATNDFKFSFE